jgi:predicted transcriptional regulator
LRGPEEQPNQRLIKGNSRYKQTPHELLVELTADGYQSLGNPSDHAGQMFQIKIMNYVQANPAMDRSTIAEAVELPRPLVQDHLDRMVVAGVLTTTGSGTRGDHKRYYIGR